MTREERAKDYAEHNIDKYTNDFANLYNAYLKGAMKETKELEKENAELKKEVEKHKWNDIFLEDCAGYDKKIAEEYTTLQECIERLEKENALVKSLLYCTKRTCDNCGFVNCENFQRQRKSEPCSLYIPYQVRIKNLAHESDVLRESYNNSEMNLAFVSEQLVKAKKIIGNLYAICKDNHYPNSSVLMEQAEQFLNSEVEK